MNVNLKDFKKGKKILCISVDMDPLDCYYKIHGISKPDPSDKLKTAHFEVGLCRLLEIFKELGIKATLFIVGQDLMDGKCREILIQAVNEGHEAANHSWSHPYNLTKLSYNAVRTEIGNAHKEISKATGIAPAGFRAPGYYFSTLIKRVLIEHEYLYDASFLPSPPYYILKTIIIAVSRIRGRKSHSIAGIPSMVFSRNRPFLMKEKNNEKVNAILEVPCSVVSFLRLPFIGTSLTVFPQWIVSSMVNSASTLDFISLQFHAIDVMNARQDGFEELIKYQPDAGVPVNEKRERITMVIKELIQKFGFIPITIREASEFLI